MPASPCATPERTALADTAGVVSQLSFEGVEGAVRFEDCAEVEAVVRAIAPGWPITQAPGAEAFMTLARAAKPDRFHVRSARGDKRTNSVNAACDVIAGLSRRFVDTDTSALCFHAAGAAFAGRMVLFPNTRRAGKSTLCAALAAAGHRIYSDDVVPVCVDESGRLVGRASGAAMRLRHPLPVMPDDVIDWIETSSGPGNAQYSYLTNTDIPRHGETLPLGAVVMLHRTEDAPARLDLADPMDAARALLFQNFARTVHSRTVLQVVSAMIDSLPVMTLTYADLGEARTLLTDRFKAWDSDIPRHAIAAADFRPRDERPRPPVPADDQPLCHAPGTERREFGADLVLCDRFGHRIHRLDGLSRGIWDTLGEPASIDEVAALVAAAFPDTPAAGIRDDVCDLMRSFAKAGLIVPVHG